MPWQPENNLIQERHRKWREWVERRGEDPFEITRFDRTHAAAEIHDQFESLAGETARVAGRVMRKARVGRLSFLHIADDSGRVQLVFERERLGEEEYGLARLFDVGDLVGAAGEIFATKTGEKSVRVQQFQLLSKALHPLPDKWHGLKDVETRYRQRYVDLIMNEEVHALFRRRSLIVRAVRRFLDDAGFLEVETPMLHALPGGALARPFATHHNALDVELYLRVAPELHLKRLVVGGFEKVYEINRNFRNEGVSTRHNPEFTMLEAYQAYADYTAIMELVERLLSTVCEQVQGGLRVTYQGQEIDWTPPWPRVRLYDALREHSGIDFEDLTGNDRAAREAGEALDLRFAPHEGFAHVVDAVFKKTVMPQLIQPTFLIDYPVELSPLAKRKPEDARLTERFQPVVGGLELGNAFSELNHPIDQQDRFEAQQTLKAAGDQEAHPMDTDYIRALEYGLPPTGGLGIGIDRLTMLLCDAASIRDVILFPLLKPEE